MRAFWKGYLKLAVREQKPPLAAPRRVINLVAVLRQSIGGTRSRRQTAHKSAPAGERA